MTGLETILHAITSDAETAAAEELEQARQKADTILTEAKAEGAKKLRSSSRKANRKLRKSGNAQNPLHSWTGATGCSTLNSS